MSAEWFWSRPASWWSCNSRRVHVSEQWGEILQSIFEQFPLHFHLKKKNFLDHLLIFTSQHFHKNLFKNWELWSYTNFVVSLFSSCIVSSLAWLPFFNYHKTNPFQTSHWAGCLAYFSLFYKFNGILVASTLTQQNVCSSNPCLHNTTCLNGYTEKGYLCLCQFGYTGKKCKIGKYTRKHEHEY